MMSDDPAGGAVALPDRYLKIACRKRITDKTNIWNPISKISRKLVARMLVGDHDDDIRRDARIWPADE